MGNSYSVSGSAPDSKVMVVDQQSTAASKEMRKMSAKAANEVPAGEEVIEPSVPDVRPLRPNLPLPPEIRLQIYGHVFDSSYNAIWRADPKKGQVRSESLNILQVSSAVSREAHEALYARTMFKFDLSRYRRVSKRLFEVKASKPTKVCIKIGGMLNADKVYPDRFERIDSLLRAVTFNGTLRHLELFINIPGFKKIAKLRTLRFLRVATTIKIHVNQIYSSSRAYNSQPDLMWAQFDLAWSIFLSNLEIDLDPTEVEGVHKGREINEPVLPMHYFEATFRLKMAPV